MINKFILYFFISYQFFFNKNSFFKIIFSLFLFIKLKLFILSVKSIYLIDYK